MVTCLGQDAHLHMAQLMPLPLTISCSRKSRLILPFRCWPTRVVPDKIQEGHKTVAFVCVRLSITVGNSKTKQTELHTPSIQPNFIWWLPHLSICCLIHACHAAKTSYPCQIPLKFEWVQYELTGLHSWLLSLNIKKCCIVSYGHRLINQSESCPWKMRSLIYNMY